MSELSVETYETVASTMDVARELASNGRPEGTVIVALAQTQGRGRPESTWHSPRGGAWFSMLLAPPVGDDKPHRSVFLGGLCVHSALRRLCGLDTVVRWPNDILFGGRKLAGVLGESLRTDVSTYYIVGVGVNTNFGVGSLPEDLREEATTTQDILGRDIDNESLIASIAELLVTRSYELGDAYDRILEEWRERSDTIGKMIEVDGEAAGRAVRLDQEGFLIVKNESGTEKTIASGTVRYAGDPALRKG